MHLGSADLERLYAAMLRIRIFEDTVHQLFLRNEIEGTTHLCQGQEAVSVGVCDILEPGDTVAATYRGHGACVAMGVEPGRLFAEFLGRATGVNGGRGGSMNVVDLERGVLGCFGIVGGSIGAGTGAALAAQLQGDGTAAVAFFGDGAVNQAYFHECLNFSGVRKLPILYACENNLYGEWTPMGKVTAGGRILARAEGYGIPGVQVDGNDVLAVREAAEKALVTARAGNGPTLIEFLTYRHKGHSRVDPGKYRPKEEVDAWLARDPIPRFATRLEPDAAERIRDELEREITDALEAARAAPFPDPEQAASATNGAP
jgi:TPP-dependent pyruvate/acetoin dehydrogenase alpha subunit